MTSETMESTRTSRTCLHSARGCPTSLITITMPSKTSWRRSWTEANCGNWPNRQPWPTASGSLASSSDHPRQLAVRHALVRFANIAAGSTFTTAEVYTPALDALGSNASQFSLASFRYDLSKLRAKGLVEKLPRSRRYRLVGKGYSVCLIFLKLFERIYAPLTAGLLKPFAGDHKLAPEKRCELDCLYQRIVDDLRDLLLAVGLKTAA